MLKLRTTHAHCARDQAIIKSVSFVKSVQLVFKTSGAPLLLNSKDCVLLISSFVFPRQFSCLFVPSFMSKLMYK